MAIKIIANIIVTSLYSEILFEKFFMKSKIKITNPKNIINELCKKLCGKRIFVK